MDMPRQKMLSRTSIQTNLSQLICTTRRAVALHARLMLRFDFFFFQAEDGIRDLIVTGVQTCALPISPAAPIAERPSPSRGAIRSPDLPRSCREPDCRGARCVRAAATERSASPDRQTP